MTRNVTMTIRKPNGALWASAAVTFDLLTKLTTRSTDSIFQYQVSVTTDANGQATAALETPAEGDGAWLWRCTPPDGNWFDFALEYGASALDLSTIIAAISLANVAPSAVAALLAAYAPNSTVSSHTSNTSNPHAVTAAQVGAASSADLTAHTGATTNVHGITNTAVLATTGANTFTAGQNLADQLLTRPVIKDYGEAVNALGNVTGTMTIDLENGNYVTATLTGAVTALAINNWPATGTLGSFTLEIAPAGNTVVWTGVTWVGDEPTLGSTIDFVVLWSRTAGSTIYAAHAGATA